MPKQVRKAIRLSEPLSKKVEEAAKERGMNWSEMVRHILTNYFFNGRKEGDCGQRDA